MILEPIYNAAISERYEFKRTKAHNTVIINDQEQCVISPEIVFGLTGDIDAQSYISEDDHFFKIQMKHNGYLRFKELGLVFREIICQKSTILIKDTVSGRGSHKISVFFHLHPNIACEVSRNSV